MKVKEKKHTETKTRNYSQTTTPIDPRPTSQSFPEPEIDKPEEVPKQFKRPGPREPYEDLALRKPRSF